jgi:uncharacterized protein
MDRKYMAIVGLLCAVPLLIGAVGTESSDDSRFTKLSLSGTGYSSQIEESVTISAGTHTFSTSASRAMRDNAARMDKLRSQLERLGIAKEDFRTTGFRFQQESDPEDHDGDRDRGFGVTHQLSVVVRGPDKSGAVLDALVAAGATDLGVNQGWSYGSDINPTSLKKARNEAILDANTKAQDYARATGMRIRRIVSISDQQAYASAAPQARFGISEATGTQIDNRPKTVLASVGMVFELEK